MDIERLKEEIKADEGYKNEIYLDHLGLPNFRGRAFDQRNRPRVWFRSWYTNR